MPSAGSVTTTRKWCDKIQPLAIRQGVSRSIYSNEAGNGTSPLIHGSADTIHPIRQGLWGAVEVFGDTIVVCMCTGLAILVTDVWELRAPGVRRWVCWPSPKPSPLGKYL